MYLKHLTAVLFLIALSPAYSQVVPAAKQERLPISVGAGFSNFYTDWSRYEAGPTVWIDWNFYRAPSLLRGFGLEVEGRDINYLRTGDVPNLREDTAGGGVIYTWRHFRRFHYYGKFIMSYGSIDFSSLSPNYHHDTRTVKAPGGGAEYRLWNSLWLRGDYEWQFWPDLGHGNTLTPNGFTIGAMFDLGHPL